MSRDDLRGELITALRRYQRATDALDEHVGRALGVNRTDQRVLDLLDERGAMTAGEIALAAGVTTGAVTGILDRLERAGYARRVRDAEDRRRVVVEPTALLAERAAGFYGGMLPKGEAALGRYSDDEIRLFIRFLDDSSEVTEQHTAELRERG